MLKKRRNVLIGLLLVCFLLQSCAVFNTPPSVDSVKQQFLSCYDDIVIVVEYMIASGYTSVNIDNTSGTIWADFNYVEVEDDAVKLAVKNLLRHYKGIYKTRNNIHLLQWTGLGDIGCGIAYSTDPEKPPVVQFMVERVQISEDNWFYYVADYESWRSGKRIE